MTDIVKRPDPTGLSIKGGKLKATASPFQQRINAVKQQQEDAATLPNRLCLMLDRSSSMSQWSNADLGIPKIELLKQAVQNFNRRCNPQDTAIAIETFPPSIEQALTNNTALIDTIALTLTASGSTPMHACVEGCLGKYPMTRGVIVSDGEATDWHVYHYDDWDDEEKKAKPNVDDLLTKYKEAGIPIDCVHIGSSTSGEELLRKIASTTGGLYLKFTDVSAFANSFGYLAPGYRAMLTDGRVDAALLGAKELL